MAVDQTVAWLDANAVPYWDLCFMRDKELVDAHVYVEDAPQNIERLEKCGRVSTETESEPLGGN